MNIFKCCDSITHELGIGKVTWESELELCCAKRKHTGCLSLVEFI